MPWPPLPLAPWRDTRDTLQMWTQIVGKICLALTPRVNHFWNIAFQVTPRGLATPALPMPGGSLLTMTFDFVAHELVIDVSDGARRTIPLQPADGRRLLHGADGDAARAWAFDVPHLDDAGRIPETRPLRARHDASLLRSATPSTASGRSLLAMQAGARGVPRRVHRQVQPGAFLLGQFRSGGDAILRAARARRGRMPTPITREAYSHEVISHGCWPGGGPVDEPAFYAYAAPEPAGLKTARVAAGGGVLQSGLFRVHPAVRSRADLAPSPEAALYAFLRTTYDAGPHWHNGIGSRLERPAAEWTAAKEISRCRCAPTSTRSRRSRQRRFASARTA